MAEINATILIPDISGFTEFMTSTELSHGTLAINMLIDSIVHAVDEKYEVAEIEGDAVLMIKKDPIPSKREIIDICLKIFNAFHFQRTWMQQHAVCPCKACMALTNLTLKFVVHHGPLAEIKVGRFVKHSGPDMIVAHRLLKNTINNNEYLLMTENVMQKATDAPVEEPMEWFSSSEDFASIGKVGYRFALLNEARKKAPAPPAPPTDYRRDNTPYYEVRINANYRDVYMVVMNIPERNQWVPGLQKVEQDMPNVFVGSQHRCTFENVEATVSPLRMNVSDEAIIFAESWQIKNLDYSLVYEYVFKNTDDQACIFAARFMNTEEYSLPEELNAMLSNSLQQMAEALKDYCEKEKSS